MRLATQLPLAVSFMLFVAALLRGAAPERLLAGALFVAAGVEVACNIVWPSTGPQASAMVYVLTDVLLFGAVAPVALHANRLYPLWLGASQIVALASHFADAALTLRPEAYALMRRVPFWFELMIMALGLFLYALRRRRTGSAVPSWSS